MARENSTCASCKEFPLAASVDAGGKAVCAMFEKERGWDFPACVIHTAATDRDARKRIVIQLMKQNDKKEGTTHA